MTANFSKTAPTTAKQHGVHYTPPELAAFLSQRILAHAGPGDLSVLDPACGDGELLASIISEGAGRIGSATGIDRDVEAVGFARTRLAGAAPLVDVHSSDFIDLDHFDLAQRKFDVIISNPPYVRTQVLGAVEAQRLAARFGLKGRVDLYQAFACRMSEHLPEGGVLGLLCSNRFLSTKGGASLRKFLSHHFEILELYDLGDTKLFSAAVLPAILIARRKKPSVVSDTEARFVRVYEAPGADVEGSDPSLFGPLSAGRAGPCRVGDVTYQIESGMLVRDEVGDGPWSLRDEAQTSLLDSVAAHSERRLGDLGKIRVGVKTTADAVFIRNDWDDLPDHLRPEDELLLPLVTHHVVERWSIAAPTTRILYPYDLSQRKRTPLDIAQFPRAAAYLETHRERLEGRKYVIEAGRHWWELWVPQRPSEWATDKLVFPDIAEEPRFAVETSGAVINGDCYWLSLPDIGVEERSLLVAVANSTFATHFYDLVCGNKLYSGRRRYITQYVERFPIPRVDGPTRKKIADLVERLESDSTNRVLEKELDDMVWSAFGVSREEA